MEWKFSHCRPHFTQAAAQLVQIAPTVSASTAPGATTTPQQIDQQQVAQPQTNVPSNNPAASNVAAGNPVLGFFGGYSTSPGQQIVQGATPTVASPPGTSGTPVHTEADLASNVSFRSLHPKPQQRL